MTQYPGTFDQPFDDSMPQPPKTSGLAITALVMSLVGFVPCCGLVTGVLGALLGLIGAVTIGSNPARKGKGLAIVALLLGLLTAGAQVSVGSWLYVKYGVPAMTLFMEGPNSALRAGFAGDVAGFKASFHGAGATATDADAAKFLDTLRDRYGAFTSSVLDQSGKPARPTPGQPTMPAPYILNFQNGPQSATCELIFADPAAQQHWVCKLGLITVHDPDKGDLTYPPPGP